MKVLRGFTRLYIAAYALWILGLAVFVYLDDPANSARTGFDYQLSKLGEEEIDTALGKNTREIELPSKWVVQVPLSWPMSEVDSYVHNIASQRPELYRSGGKAQSAQESKGEKSARAQAEAIIGRSLSTLPEGQLDVVQHPTLGTLKFPHSMPFAERNQLIAEMVAKTTPTDADRQLRTLLFEQRRIALTRQRDEMTNFHLILHSLTTWAGWTMILFVPLGLFLFSLAAGYSLRWIYRGFAGK